MTMITQTATGFIGIGHRISTVVNGPDAAVVALFSILGLPDIGLPYDLFSVVSRRRCILSSVSVTTPLISAAAG